MSQNGSRTTHKRADDVVEPNVRVSGILLKAKEKENKPTSCIFCLGSVSEYSSFLRCAQVMLRCPEMLSAASARAGLDTP